MSKRIDKSTAKITAVVSLIGTLGAIFVIFYNDIVMPESEYTLAGRASLWGVMLLFKKDCD